MTVTLEDGGYILGLLVHGEALTSGLIENRLHILLKIGFERLTDKEVENALYRGNIKFKWLFGRFGRHK